MNRLTPPSQFRLTLVALVAATSAGLVACGGGSDTVTVTCVEPGVSANVACQTGATEPLYTYQWALQASGSFFAAFKNTFASPTDLNVEPLHREGFKGLGVNVLVLDDGIDVAHEDLVANVDRTQTHNFITRNNDPTPTALRDSHGTHVAGIIGAAQNGLGVMGIAPRVTLGGANSSQAINPELKLDLVDVAIQSYGGAAWSSRADVINGSFGLNPEAPLPLDAPESATSNQLLRAMVNLRNQKGAVLVKSAGNEFLNFEGTRTCPPGVSGHQSCDNPAHDPEMLEPTVIATGATNSLGVKSSYSSAGPVLWVAGYGGEFGEGGTYGEGQGAAIFSTDLRGCDKGYSRSALDPAGDTVTDFLRGITSRNGRRENEKCDYGYMNGTSAAAPTITGVVALMLSANPALTWRDVRDILRESSRPVDPQYGQRGQLGFLLDLRTGTFSNSAVGTSADLQEGSSLVRVDYGWQTNTAGNRHSNWYGFGIPDATRAVQLARSRTQNLPAALSVPTFSPAFSVNQLSYGQVQKLGQFTVSGDAKVDALQLRLSGNFCVGAVGLLVKSPAGTVSVLANPFNIYYLPGVSSAQAFGLGSYTFHGESAKGVWTVYGLNGLPGLGGAQNSACAASPTANAPLSVEYRVLPMAS